MIFEHVPWTQINHSLESDFVFLVTHGSDIVAKYIIDPAKGGTQ